MSLSCIVSFKYIMCYICDSISPLSTNLACYDIQLYSYIPYFTLQLQLCLNKYYHEQILVSVVNSSPPGVDQDRVIRDINWRLIPVGLAMEATGKALTTTTFLQQVPGCVCHHFHAPQQNGKKLKVGIQMEKSFLYGMWILYSSPCIRALCG